jgi:ribosomal protein S27E
LPRVVGQAGAVPNTRFHLTAAPVALWAAGVTEAQPQVKPAVRATNCIVHHGGRGDFMTLIECPGCKTAVDIDRSDIEKQEDGLQLIVKCPDCAERFMIQRVAWIRQKLEVAQYGYVVDQSGQKIRIKLEE